MRLSLIASLLFVGLTIAPQHSLAATTNACGSLELRRGTVAVGTPIAVATPLPAGARACLGEIGRALAARPDVRSVTVALRLPDRQRANAEFKSLVNIVRDLVLASGMARRKLSVVVPATRKGEAASISVSYRERRSSRAVAMITSTTGVVRSGRYRSSLGASSKGSRLVAYEYVRTPDADSSARLVLADKSEIRVYPRSLIRIGPVVLTAKLKRRVTIDLLAGSIKTHAQYGGAGSQFDVKTRTAVAGVRGTNFRVALDGAFTRIETLGGSVALAGSKSTVPVTAGFGSRVDTGGAPEKPRALLPAPGGLSPVLGRVTAGSKLSWRATGGASGYVVELARDAYFTQGFRAIRSAANSLAVPTGSTGMWFWRVQGVDTDGFVGTPSKVYAFTVP